MINKCAFVIPMHPDAFQHGYKIIEELMNKDTDVYFIFTNIQEKNMFISCYNNQCNVNYLLLSDFTNCNLFNIVKYGFDSLKKLYGVSMLYDKYDYISCVNADINFIKKTNFYDMMKTVVDSKIIYGGFANYDTICNSIITTSLQSCAPPDCQIDLRRVSGDYTVFTLWSNLPVYSCKIMPQFLYWMKFSPETLSRFGEWFFIDLLYNYYMVLIHNYQIKIIPDYPHSLELANSDKIVIMNKYNNLFWVNKNAYSQNKEYYDTHNFYIVFHMDKTNFDI